MLSHSKKNTVRGLHFQRKNPQGKFITVVQGEILDVAVDLRKNSKLLENIFLLKLKKTLISQFLFQKILLMDLLVFQKLALFTIGVQIIDIKSLKQL